jgi:Zn-dependent peptidase ImmA (M78 family)
MLNDRLSVELITTKLLDHVSDDVQQDLRFEDAAVAAETHFAPVVLQPLPSRSLFHGDCATDGYYDSHIDPMRPRIFYASDVNDRRVRFTILHELGHHLLQNVACELLEDIDKLGASIEERNSLEESVCHNFAGRILVTDELLRTTIGHGNVRPENVHQLYLEGAASWEAIAVRVAGRLLHRGAIVLISENGSVRFCAQSPIMGWLGWPRGSQVEPGGALSNSLISDQTDEVETYRYGRSYACQMTCETLRIHGGLVIAVLSELPSDRSWSSVDAWEPPVQFCKSCIAVERSVGWCDDCKGRRCPNCDECGCAIEVKNPVCSKCHMYKPHRKGSEVCRDCE